MLERERGPTRDPPQPVLTDMEAHTFNGGGGGPDAADDTEDKLHRLSVYETNPPRDGSATPERKNRIVVQIQGHDYALGHSSHRNCEQQPSALSYTRRNWALKSKYRIW